MMLVEICASSHDVDLDIVYATPANVAGRALYRRPACYLAPAAAAMLGKAARIAGDLGYRLRVFDAFRPIEAQFVLFAACREPDFVSDPRAGAAPHCRGAAVDLTLADAAGRPLDMGTGFDDFSPRAHHDSDLVGAPARRNRAVLLGVMSVAGWDFYMREWWHYQLFQPRRLPLLGDGAAVAAMLAEDPS